MQNVGQGAPREYAPTIPRPYPLTATLKECPATTHQPSTAHPANPQTPCDAPKNPHKNRSANGSAPTDTHQKTDPIHAPPFIPSRPCNPPKPRDRNPCGPPPHRPSSARPPRIHRHSPLHLHPPHPRLIPLQLHPQRKAPRPYTFFLQLLPSEVIPTRQREGFATHPGSALSFVPP
jgi:hypothetical protein